MQLSHRYEVEQMELKSKVSDLHRQLAEMGARGLGSQTCNFASLTAKSNIPCVSVKHIAVVSIRIVRILRI